MARRSSQARCKQAPPRQARLQRALLPLAVLAALNMSGAAALAQPNLRSSFPGRRVGGATRGLCSSRLIVHLVPANSVFAGGPSRLLGILEGPSSNPAPVQVSFLPPAGGAGPSLTLPASGAAVVLLRQPPGPTPSRWESTYKCEPDQPSANDDPLAFVRSATPPALSLLVADVTPDDQRIQQSLQALLKACGTSVSRDQLARDFGLSDVLSEGEWPAALPVLCPA